METKLQCQRSHYKQSRYRGRKMRYEVVLLKTEEGYAVTCPALPGCWSQGTTRDDALVNIADAITLYLECTLEQTRERRDNLVREATEDGLQVELCDLPINQPAIA